MLIDAGHFFLFVLTLIACGEFPEGWVLYASPRYTSAATTAIADDRAVVNDYRKVAVAVEAVIDDEGEAVLRQVDRVRSNEDIGWSRHIQLVDLKARTIAVLLKNPNIALKLWLVDLR